MVIILIEWMIAEPQEGGWDEEEEQPQASQQDQGHGQAGGEGKGKENYLK